MLNRGIVSGCNQRPQMGSGAGYQVQPMHCGGTVLKLAGRAPSGSRRQVVRDSESKGCNRA